MGQDDIYFVGKFDDPNDPRQIEELWAWMMRMQGRLNQFDQNAFALAWLEGYAAGAVIASAGVGAAPVWSASPLLTGLTLSGLTASQPVKTTAGKALASGLIVNADVDNAAAIAGSKIDGTGLNADTVDTKHAADFILKSAAASPYSISNDVTDRTFDADTVLVAELADVTATIIKDLHTAGVPGF